jgi:hypothetical protein
MHTSGAYVSDILTAGNGTGEKRMYKPSNIEIMSPITKAIDALFLISGLERTETQRMDLTGLNDLFINRHVYENSTGERVFITSQEREKTT